MAIGAVKRLDVQRESGVAGEGLEELAHKLGVESADPLGRKLGLEDEERPAGHVERDPGQGLIHRQQAVGVAGQSPLVAKRFHQRLPKRDPCVLDRMMIVDVAISLGPNGDVDKGMTRQLVEHMIEKADAGGDVGKPRSIEIKADLNARLVGLAYDCALAHGDFFCLKPLGPGDSKPRRAWPPKQRPTARRVVGASLGEAARGFRREAKFHK